MKAGKTANDYRESPWATKPGRVVEPTNPESPKSPKPYPRHVKDADGNVHLVTNHRHERSITGKPMLPNGEPQRKE